MKVKYRGFYFYTGDISTTQYEKHEFDFPFEASTASLALAAQEFRTFLWEKLKDIIQPHGVISGESLGLLYDSEFLKERLSLI